LDIVSTGTSFTLPGRAPKIYFNQSSIVSVNENKGEEFFVNVFPNPSKGIINIKTNSNSYTDVEIYNLLGSKVFQRRYFEPTFNIRLNVSPGIYSLHLSIESLNYSRKVIIE
jgi:hypothetical protein